MRNARYLHERIDRVKHHYQTRVVLALCDVVNPRTPTPRAPLVPCIAPPNLL
jgi:hypothetical protein